MNESNLITTNEPTVMTVSAYSGIAQKLNFLAQGIKDLKDAERSNVYIECYDKTDDADDNNEQSIKTIRFSTDLYVSTEINPYDKFNGDLLDESIAVNLYDLYNITTNCQDEVLSFWVDGDELVINSYYQPEKDIDELEVRLKITDRGFKDRSDSIVEDKTPVSTITLSSLSMVSIIKQLNCENKADGVNFVIKDNKLRFESKYNGFDSILTIKDIDDQVFFKDISAFIPFYAFNLMSATGQISDVKFNVYDDTLVVNTEEYDFIFPLDNMVESFDINDDNAIDYFVIDAKLFEVTLDLINRLNTPADISEMEIEYVSQGEADLTCVKEGRYTISVRTDLAMLCKESIKIDSDIFAELFKLSNVDAIKVKLDTDTKKLYIKFENGILTRQVVYDHDTFMEYRKKSLADWKDN
jgi:hypothetical protein